MNQEELIRRLNAAPTAVNVATPQWVMYLSDKGENSCPACLSNHGKVFAINDPALPRLPLHPNCRCRYIAVAAPNRSDLTLNGRLTDELRQLFEPTPSADALPGGFVDVTGQVPHF